MLYSCLSFSAVCLFLLRSSIEGMNPEGNGIVCVVMSFYKYFFTSDWQYLLWSSSMSKLNS
jgi:hypothetical protein